MKNKALIGILLFSFIALVLFYGCGEVVREAREETTTTTTATTTTTSSTTTTTVITSVDTPVFSGAFLPGTHEVASLEVVISTTTPGAQIYYTTDGSTPNTTSSLYTGPINLNNSATISAIGVLGEITSDVLSDTFYIRWWSEVGGGLDGPVRALQFDDDGNLYVGGGFSLAGETGDTLPVYNIALWDGASWNSVGVGVNNGVNGAVWALALGADGILYVGGDFTQSGITNLYRVAQWVPDPGDWVSMLDGFNGRVKALICDPASGNVFAGGEFTRNGSDAENRNHISYWDAALSTWNEIDGGIIGPDRDVSALAIGGGRLYAGGNFVQIGGGDNEHFIAYIALTDGDPDGSWNRLGTEIPTGNPIRSVLYLDAENIIAGGEGGFGALEPAANRIASWNSVSRLWSYLGEGFTSAVLALAEGDDGGIIAGGEFLLSGPGTADEISVRHIAWWNETKERWQAFGTGLNDNVYAIAVDASGRIYVGGDFTEAGGIPANHLAVWGIK